MRHPVRTAVVPLALLAAACSSSGPGYSGSGSRSSSAPATTAAVSPGAPAISISGFAFTPNPLDVAPGAKVAVTNKDSADHTLTSDTTGLFNADNLGQGDTVTFTAPTKPGTYAFHCAIHPSMHGTLVVK